MRRGLNRYHVHLSPTIGPSLEGPNNPSEGRLRGIRGSARVRWLPRASLAVGCSGTPTVATLLSYPLVAPDTEGRPPAGDGTSGRTRSLARRSATPDGRCEGRTGSCARSLLSQPAAKCRRVPGSRYRRVRYRGLGRTSRLVLLLRRWADPPFTACLGESSQQPVLTRRPARVQVDHRRADLPGETRLLIVRG